MKSMKRILALAMALVMACGLLVVPAAAAGEDVTFTVGEWVQTGNTGSVTVVATGKDGAFKASGIGVSLKYNKDVLTFTGSEAGADLNGLTFMGQEVSTANGVANVAAIDITSTSHDLPANAVLVTYKFEVKADVESCDVDFELDAGNTTLTDGVVDRTVAVVKSTASVKGADPTLGTVSLSADTATADGANAVTVTATATSTSDKTITGLVDWTVEAPAGGKGVTVAADGKITVDAKAVAGAYTIKATPKTGESKGDAKTATLTVSRNVSAVTEVLGASANKNTVVIPVGEDAVTAIYAVDVKDQYGDAMTGQTVTWEAGALPDGVTFDAATATLTVAKGATAGEVTLTAKVGEKTATIKVNVTNISFTISDGAKTVKADPAYGDSWASLVTINKGKITAEAGAVVTGEYTVNWTDKGDAAIPAAGDHAYTVTFTGGAYTDIPVEELAGTVTVAPKAITVTAKDVSARVRTEVAEVKALYGYENTALVGDDKLTGTPGYTLYALNDDGTVSSTMVTLTEEVMEQANEYAIVVSGLDVPNANYTIAFSNAGRLEIRKKMSNPPPLGTGTNPDGSQKDPENPTPDKLVFDDVVEGDWFYDAVNYVAENKLMNGTADKTFSPYANTSRAMIATILWRKAGSPEPRARIADFPDVVDGSWYADAVRWCAETGVVTGFEDGTFGPDKEITREQLAVMLYRYADSPEVDAAMGMAGFEDVESISDWAADAMRWAVQNGIMNGKNGTLLDPQGLATRAETAAMFQRYLTKK